MVVDHARVGARFPADSQNPRTAITLFREFGNRRAQDAFPRAFG
jgi:hypothetical protein